MGGGSGGCHTLLAPPPAPPGATIALQRNETPPRDHPQLHRDLHAKDATEQETEAAALIALGAECVDWDSCPADPDFVVLADPEGDRSPGHPTARKPSLSPWGSPRGTRTRGSPCDTSDVPPAPAETAGQAARLRRIGGLTGQGWLYSRAMAPDMIDELIRPGPARSADA
jgi:hypothetical protein